MVFLLLLVVGVLHAQEGAQQTDYAALLQRTSQHQQQAFQDQQRLEFYERRKFEWGCETRAVIETAQGRLDRVIAYNDRPLAADQEKKQAQRLTKLLNDPEALKDELADQRNERKRRQLIAKTMPQAFLIKFSAKEPDGMLRFEFTPNPDFSPNGRETRVFQGMRGMLWIDPEREMIVRARGELFKDVSFGWGILGRLYKGGQFEIVQEQVRPGQWRITTLDLNLKGRVFFSGLRVLLTEKSSDFVPTPGEMDARAALQRLLSHPARAVQAEHKDQTVTSARHGGGE